jgi:hypothetical protein
MATPWRMTGSEFAFASVVIEGAGRCVRGELANDQHVGALEAPAGSSVRLCGGALTEALGNGGGSVQFGRYFGTQLMTGRPLAPPHAESFASVQTAGPGFWLQIGSLCTSPSGIKVTQPAAKRWLYLDKTGEPTTAVDRAELDGQASVQAKPCPVMTSPPP